MLDVDWNKQANVMEEFERYLNQRDDVKQKNWAFRVSLFFAMLLRVPLRAVWATTKSIKKEYVL